MSGPIHIFRCDGLDLYGLTRDPSGGNLPRDMCETWQHLRSFEVTRDAPQWGVDVDWQERSAAVEAGLSLNGYFLSEGAALPPELRRGANGESDT